jgi:dipeptidyl aminopeptidase/acylaminoacyl peptidase
VLHGEDDLRCPPDQGLRLHAALVRRGVPAELLLFPGEGHDLRRPLSRRARLEHLLRWWSRWLSAGDEDDGPPPAPDPSREEPA